MTTEPAPSSPAPWMVEACREILGTYWSGRGEPFDREVGASAAIIQKHAPTPAKNAPGDVGLVVTKLHRAYSEIATKVVDFPTSEIAHTITDAIAALRRLEQWKAEALAVESWWAKIDQFVRDHPQAMIGRNVSDTALVWLKERDALKAQVKKWKSREAVCHCGEPMSAHGMDCGHSPVEMPELCPYAEKLAAAVGEVARLKAASDDAMATIIAEHSVAYAAVLQDAKNKHDNFCKETLITSTLRATVAQLEAENEALAGALEMAVNTVECDSLDKDGNRLPWYRTTKAALAARNTRRAGHATKDL